MRTPTVVILLLALIGCASAQSQWVDLKGDTIWEEAPDLKIIEKNLQFKPEGDMGGGGKAAPMIKVDLTIKNIGKKEIKAATIEILLFCEGTGKDADTKRIKVKPFIYRDAILPNDEGSFLYQPSVWGLTLPVRQTIRIAQIEYADGSIWKRARLKE